MPYTVLYRKKRPRTFAQVVGQPHIVEALRNQLRSSQTSHAYLFCGTRGTGKTTAAKIMARAINCTDLKDGDPCNTCPTCESILADRCLDVAEIDAASNNGVDDIRNLRDEVKYPPTECTHKVYIIDEVHMLTTSAFNALLKTLEEPPPHVVFILATTDPQKVPVTVLSRCQRYDFRRIKTPDIVAALAKYLDEEDCPYEKDSLEYIAYHCDGAMRDALSLLDQALSLRSAPDAPLRLETVRDLLGAVDREVLFAFTDTLAGGDGFGVLSIIDSAAKEGRDMGQLAADLVRHFRDALVASLIKGTDGLDVSADMAGKLKAQGERISPGKLMEYIHVFSETLRELRFAPHKRTALEVCALGLCVERVKPAQATPAAGEGMSHVACTPNPRKERADDAQSLLRESPPPPLTGSHENDTQQKPPEKKAQKQSQNQSSNDSINDFSEGSSDIMQAIQTDWVSICNNFPDPLRAFIARSTVTPQGEQLLITCNNNIMVEQIKKHQMTIREALAERYMLTTPPNLAFTVGVAYNKPTSSQIETKLDEVLTMPIENEAPPDDDWAAFGQQSVDGDSPW
ncbi:MAG: DNA polymerase III subunit gamma/tau [Defluviitaleaceae bacterium]|nr:DNA polymerase III subunit gamma/tau [Defluviitaleaceae bacterium]